MARIVKLVRWLRAELGRNRKAERPDERYSPTKVVRLIAAHMHQPYTIDLRRTGIAGQMHFVGPPKPHGRMVHPGRPRSSLFTYVLVERNGSVTHIGLGSKGSGAGEI